MYCKDGTGTWKQFEILPVVRLSLMDSVHHVLTYVELQEEGSYIQQITTVDGQTIQHLMTGDNQVTEVRHFHSGET